MVEILELVANFALKPTLGIIGLLSVIVSIFMFRKMNTLEKQLFIISILLLFFKFILMDTGLLDNTFIVTMQFGWRLYTIIIPVLIVLLLQSIMKFEKRNKRNITFILITIYFLITSCFSALYLSDNREKVGGSSEIGTEILKDNNYYKKDINDWARYHREIGTGLEYLPTTFFPLDHYLSSGKFLPDGSIGLISNNNTTTFLKENKGYGKLEANFNSSNYDSIVAPFIYYKHYYNVKVNGEKVNYQQSEEGYIEIIIPEIMDGELIIQYQTPWFVTLSRIFSLISLFIFSFVVFTEHRKKDLV